MEGLQPKHWSTLQGKAWLALLASRADREGSASRAQLSLAMKEVNQALGINPGEVHLYLLKARLYLELARTAPSERRDHLRSAGKVLAQAQAKFPSSSGIEQEIKHLAALQDGPSPNSGPAKRQ